MTEEVTQETAQEAPQDESLLNGVVTDEPSAPVDNPEGHPEWFLADKYKSIEEQAKAYPELAKKFGGFTGAPEEYEFTMAEGVDFELAEDDPLMADFKEIAKKHNMSQEAFNEFSNFYIEQMIADQKLAEEQAQGHREEQMKLLGPKADERLQNVASWAKAQLGSEELFNAFAAGLTDAGMVQVMEKLMEGSKSAPQATSHQQPASPPITKEQLEELQFATNEFGQRKMAVDPEYRKMVEAKYQQLYGTGHTKQVI